VACSNGLIVPTIIGRQILSISVASCAWTSEARRIQRDVLHGGPYSAGELQAKARAWSHRHDGHRQLMPLISSRPVARRYLDHLMSHGVDRSLIRGPGSGALRGLEDTHLMTSARDRVRVEPDAGTAAGYPRTVGRSRWGGSLEGGRGEFREVWFRLFLQPLLSLLRCHTRFESR